MWAEWLDVKAFGNHFPIPDMEYTTPNYSFCPCVAPSQQLKKGLDSHCIYATKTIGYTHIVLVYIAEWLLGLALAIENSYSKFPKVWNEFHQIRQSRYLAFFSPHPPPDYKEIELFPELLVFSKSWFKTILAKSSPQKALSTWATQGRRRVMKNCHRSLKFCYGVNCMGELKTTSILISTGQCGLALLCHTACLCPNTHQQLPPPSCLAEDIRTGIPPVLTTLFITGNF